MSQDLKKQLKRFRTIEPDESFLRGSKALIFSFEKKRNFTVKTYLVAWAASFALVFLVILGYVFIPTRGNVLPLASAETLNRELADMNINITLQEVSYNNEVNQTINNAISAITSNKAPHLNGDVLQSESAKITSSTVTDQSSKIDNLLNQVLQ